MGITKTVMALGSALLISTSVSGERQLCEGFVPENNLWISANTKNVTGITEEQFNAVIDKLEQMYAPVLAEKGGTLSVQRNWSNGTVNAYASRSGSTWIVSMFGGLARHATITEDGFALVMCHELGHHIGGAPKYTDWWGTPDWASNEGQSDYFASLKCLRNYFADQDNWAYLEGKEIEPVVLEKCQAQHPDSEMQAICARMALAGQSVSYLFQALRKEPNAPLFATPDQRQVSKTSHSHPGTQCRMDTYFQGALCSVDASEEVDQANRMTGTCNEDLHTEGLRPRCWFSPNEEALH